MGHLLSRLFITLRRNLLLFVSIVVILACGTWIRTEWKNIQGIVSELPSLERAQQDVNRYQDLLTRETVEGLGRLSGAMVQQLDARIRTVDDDLHRLQREQEKAPPLVLTALNGPDTMAKSLTHAVTTNIRIELLRQERAYLVASRARVHAMAHRKEAMNRLAQLRQAHVEVYAEYQSALRRKDAFKANGGLGVRFHVGPTYRQLQALDKQVKDLWIANDAAYRAFLKQRDALNSAPAPGILPAFAVDVQRLTAAAEPLRERLLHARRLAAESYLWQAWQAVRPLLPIAFGVLVGWWLVPAAIRTLFYFVLAPLAARRPPIVIGPVDRRTPASPSLAQLSCNGSSLISAISQKAMLAPGQELLIRPEYCQSQPLGAIVSTKVLFDWHRWLTSIAAHLWMLKRLRTTQTAAVVVSPTADALDEVALLEIGPGDAFVLQPRALVDIVYRTGERPRIRSHWRLGTLHAWLTLQLRYLSFEGPATLIVKGCRGVRLENASTGRTISQHATLGFSRNTTYATVRTEPFIPYLMGRQPLLQDRFTGQDACYLYEEVPRNARPGQPGHNPLEVLLDAGLKAFGI
ncbi:hypothetical protein [Massilia sp. Root335]|uniref:hypothetical protein n=1 Tax=Massilia sp. Root335 TaxID=1736517 RepID=UPI0006FCBA2D|nr:hypothetical protein [Massilia sp. Root335]KQV46379.1 hypothetical protein ASC93_14725 [Massilia sp. Root335]